VSSFVVWGDFFKFYHFYFVFLYSVIVIVMWHVVSFVLHFVSHIMCLF